MKVVPLKIKDILLIEPQLFVDERGWFIESYNEQKFNDALIAFGVKAPKFVQDNHSFSKAGTIRGLHYQKLPHAQDKLVRVVQGRAWDVVVDIREGSETFGEWIGVELSAENRKQLWIPIGFAHGFIALEDNTQLLYKTTDYYYPELERSLRWDDAGLAIEWPLDGFDQLLVNSKDLAAKTLHEARQDDDLFHSNEL